MEDRHIIKPDRPQAGEVGARKFVRRGGKFDREVEHRPVGFGEVRLRMVPPQLGGEFLVEAGPAEELQVALQSVEALVPHRDDCGDHFLLASGER